MSKNFLNTPLKNIHHFSIFVFLDEMMEICFHYLYMMLYAISIWYHYDRKKQNNTTVNCYRLGIDLLNLNIELINNNNIQGRLFWDMF